MIVTPFLKRLSFNHISQFQSDKVSAIADCTKAIELDPVYVKAYLRRAHFYEEADKLDEALADYKKVLTFDPAHTESICATKVKLNYL